MKAQISLGVVLVVFAGTSVAAPSDFGCRFRRGFASTIEARCDGPYVGFLEKKEPIVFSGRTVGKATWSGLIRFKGPVDRLDFMPSIIPITVPVLEGGGFPASAVCAFNRLGSECRLYSP